MGEMKKTQDDAPITSVAPRTPPSGPAGEPPTSQAGTKVESLTAPPDSTGALADQEAAILAFERRWWRHAGMKEDAIRSELGLTAIRYYQVLNALIDSQAALEHDPVLVGRLRRLRDDRRGRHQ